MSTPDLHPEPATLAAYQARRLPPAAVLTVSDHLAGCEACRAELARLRGETAATAAAGFALPVAAVDEPTYEELSALLDGTLPPAQAGQLRARLAASPGAAAEFADLQAFRAELAGQPARVHRPATLPAARKVLPLPGWAWASLAAAAVLLVSASWWFRPLPTEVRAPALLAQVDLAQLPAELRASVEQAARTGTLPPPVLPAGLRPPAGTLAGATDEASASFRALDPVGEVVRSDQPALRWTTFPRADAYVVYLVASDGSTPSQSLVLPATVTTWTPGTALTRGTTYEWQVEARLHGEPVARAPKPPAPEARFQILDAPHTALLAETEHRFPHDPLVLGVAYARAGLDTAAATQFAALARQNPRSDAARKLAAAWPGQLPP